MSMYAADSEGLLAPITSFLNNPLVSEILVNRPEEVWVETEGKLECHPVSALTPRHLQRLFQLIANENHQVLSVEHPLLSGNLRDGTRVQLVLPPTAKHHTLSIRRKVVQDFTLDDYASTFFYKSAKCFNHSQNSSEYISETDKNLQTLYQTQNFDLFIRLAIEAKKNIVISGGTSSGKTTFLNACLRHIPLNERIITLEDTREIQTPHLNQVNLIASKGEQGKAHLSLQDLLQCTLRLRPDRIILGEIRGKEILEFVSSCSTGHEGSITSIHANNPHIALRRMVQLYKLNHVPSMTDSDILSELNSVIDVIVQVNKTNEGRQVQSVYFKGARS